MEGSQIAKWLIFIGIGIVVLGVIVWIIYKTGIPIGKLPGDVHKFGIYFPIVTSIALSVILTLVINLIFWLYRK